MGRMEWWKNGEELELWIDEESRQFRTWDLKFPSWEGLGVGLHFTTPATTQPQNRHPDNSGFFT
jgi:hypothetical protein